MAGKPKTPPREAPCRCLTVHHDHGTPNRYKDGCRCTPCRTAEAELARHRYRLKVYGRFESRVPLIGVQRRLRALTCLGWTGPRIAAEAGLTSEQINRYRGGYTGDTVELRTWRAVADTYRKLQDLTPPEDTHRQRQAASKARNIATRAGYLPPIAWDDDTIDDPDAEPYASLPVDVDEVKVERIVLGTADIYTPEHITRAERAAIVAELAARGWSRSAIQNRLHVLTRQPKTGRSAA